MLCLVVVQVLCSPVAVFVDYEISLCCHQEWAVKYFDLCQVVEHLDHIR